MIISFAGSDASRDKIFNKCKLILKNFLFKEVEIANADGNSDCNYIVNLNKDFTNLFLEYKLQKVEGLILQRCLLDSAVEAFLSSRNNLQVNHQAACLIANQFLDNFISKYSIIFLLLSDKDYEYNEEIKKIIKDKQIGSRIKLLKGSEQEKINLIKKSLEKLIKK